MRGREGLWSPPHTHIPPWRSDPFPQYCCQDAEPKKALTFLLKTQTFSGLLIGILVLTGKKKSICNLTC